MNRTEHMRWCKQRALEYLNHGDLQSAVASMISDLGKHEETAGLNGELGLIGMMYVLQHDVDGVRRWIEGFRE